MRDMGRPIKWLIYPTKRKQQLFVLVLCIAVNEICQQIFPNKDLRGAFQKHLWALKSKSS